MVNNYNSITLYCLSWRDINIQLTQYQRRQIFFMQVFLYLGKCRQMSPLYLYSYNYRVICSMVVPFGLFHYGSFFFLAWMGSYIYFWVFWISCSKVIIKLQSLKNFASHLVPTIQRKSSLCIPRKGIGRPRSQFLHSYVPVSDLYQDWSTYLAAAK